PARTWPGTRSRPEARARSRYPYVRCVWYKAASCRSAVSVAPADRRQMPCPKAVIDLARIDQVRALAAGQIEAVPFVAVQREARDHQRLALRTGFLDPVVTPARGIDAVAHLRDHAFEPDLAGVGVHLWPVDLETLADLDVGAVDDLFQVRLALDQRQLPQIAAIEVEQIERDQHDLGRSALQLVLQHREVGGAIFGGRDDLAVDDRGTGVDVPFGVGDLAETLGPVIAAPGEDLDRLVGEMDLHPVAVELDFMYPARAAWHLLDGCRE